MMTKPLLFAAALLLAAPLAAQPMRLLVPLYAYPCVTPEGCQDEGTPFYEKVAQAGNRGIPTTAIINPNNGDFDETNPDFIPALDLLVSAGVQQIGYVYTGYGTRDEAVVRDRIDAYVEFYGGYVTGIFFDEVSPSPDDAAYYNGLCAYAASQGLGFTVLNWGTVPGQEVVTSCDVVIPFENPYHGTPDEPWQDYEPPAWLRDFGPARLAVIVNDADEAEMERVVEEAAQHGHGYVYVTDDVKDNPYNFSPTYWAAELDVVEATTVNTEPAGPSAPRLSLSVLGSNPVGRLVKLALTAPAPGHVQVNAFDVLGRRVALLYDGPLQAGTTGIDFDAAALAPGAYVIAARSTSSGTATARLTVAE